MYIKILFLEFLDILKYAFCTMDACIPRDAGGRSGGRGGHPLRVLVRAKTN
jgi:hypothetical protein